MAEPKTGNETEIREGPPPTGAEIRAGEPAFSIQKPTGVRHRVLVLAVAVAVLLYVDRYVLSNAQEEIGNDLHISKDAMAQILAAFFLPYALGQIPFGFLSDRFGARRTLSVLIVAWSAATGLIGLAIGFADLYTYRLLCGLFESGAYPACAGIIKRWIPVSRRGLASGIVSIGGRIGGTVTPFMTAQLMIVSPFFFPDLFHWRPVFVLVGLLGVILGIVFWWTYRDTPGQHPHCNAAEIDLIQDGSPAAPAGSSRIPLREILTNRSLWICSFMQFGVNFGWAFLVLSLYSYLSTVHHADLAARGVMGSTITFMALPSLILGGWLVDACIRRFGRRWGHSLPMALPRFVAASLYAFLAMLGTIWTEPTPYQTWFTVLTLGTIAFFSDLTLPSIWSYCITVGGRDAGFVLGWSNMWGNLGAFCSPIAVQWVANAAGWNAVFAMCSVTFYLVAISALLVDTRETLPGA
jgi:ACS family glucarate transporter-like MFS transporter